MQMSADLRDIYKACLSSCFGHVWSLSWVLSRMQGWATHNKYISSQFHLFDVCFIVTTNDFKMVMEAIQQMDQIDK